MLDKKVSLSNSAAKITSVKLESNNLITYFTEDAHSLFVGALVSISGVTGGPTGATQPNPVVSNVYRIDNPTTFTVYSTTAYTATSFPATFTSSGLVKAAQGSLSGVKLSYAQPVKATRPTFFNFISPTITAVASGNKVLLSWDASGIANPTPIVSIGRYDSTNTFLETVAGTSATIASISNSSGVVTYVGDNTFIPGQTVTITGASSTAYNVTLPVATATSGAFTISTTATGTTSTAAATALTPEIGVSVIDPRSTNLTNGDVYNYRIIAANDASTVNASTSVTALYVNPPTSVSAISATNAASINISWPLPEATATLTGYQIQRSVDGGAYSTSYATSATNTYSDTSITSTQSFAYKIVALADYTSAGTGIVVSGTSVASTTVTPIYVVPPVPAAAPTASTANNITVTWSAPDSSSAITGYTLQRSSNSGSTWSSDLTLTSPTATTYVDSSAPSSGGLSYIYRLSASNSSLTSDYTSSLAASSYFLDFSSLTAANTSLSTTTVTISGSYLSNPAITGYNIQRSTSAGSGYTDIVATDYSTQLPYIDTTVAQGTTYYYTVVAKNAQLTSETSVSRSVTTRSLPVAPVLTSSNTNAYTNQLSWNAPTSSFTITNYTLERSPDNSTWTGIYTGATRSFTDTGLTQTTTYYYRVKANTAAGSGPYSTVVTQATRTASVQRATFNSTGTWTRPPGVTTADVLVVGAGELSYGAYWNYRADWGEYRFTIDSGGAGGRAVLTTSLNVTSASSYLCTVAPAPSGFSDTTTNSSFGSLVTAQSAVNFGGFGGRISYMFDIAYGAVPSDFVISAPTTNANGRTGGTVTTVVTATSQDTHPYVERVNRVSGGGAGTGASASGRIGGAGLTSDISGTSTVYGKGGDGASVHVALNGTKNLVGNTAAIPANTGNGGHSRVPTTSDVYDGTGAYSYGAAGVIIIKWFD
jgi:hypothetical protein